ncbi:hypothetical protein IAT40_005436 [Kwoniella sp. CBS 6097]
MTAVAFSGLAAGSLVLSKRPGTATVGTTKAFLSVLRNGPESKILSTLGMRRSISSSAASLGSKIDSVNESEVSATADSLSPEQLKALLNGPANYDILRKAHTELMNKGELTAKAQEDLKNELIDVAEMIFKNPETFPGLMNKEDVSVEEFLKNRGMTQGEMQGKIAEFLKGEKKLVLEYDETDGKNSKPTVTFVPTSRAAEDTASASAAEELTNSEDGYEGIKKRPSLSELHQLIESLPSASSEDGSGEAFGPDWQLALPLTRSVAGEFTPQAYARGEVIGTTMEDRWKDVRFEFHDFRGLKRDESEQEIQEHLEGTWESTGDVKLWKVGSRDRFIVDQATVTFKDGAVYSLTHQNVSYRISHEQSGVLLEVLADDSHKLLKDPAAKQLGPNDPTHPHMFDGIVLEARAVNAEIYAIAAKRVEPSAVADMVAKGDRLDFWLNLPLNVRSDIDQYKQKQSWNVRVANFGLYGTPSWYSTDITVIYNTVPLDFQITDDCVVPIHYEDGKFIIRPDEDVVDDE